MSSLVFLDVECYINYFLVCFKSHKTTKFYEMYNDNSLDRLSISKILSNYTTVGFNSKSYDLYMLMHAIQKVSNNESLKRLSDNLINKGNVKKDLKLWDMPWKHIDLFNIAPKIDSENKVGLKVYGSRLNTRLLQELPISINETISDSQCVLLRSYCENDVKITKELYEQCKENLDIRKDLSLQYNTDLMSSSNSQIAEKIVRNLFKIKKVNNVVYDNFKFKPCENLTFKSKEIIEWLDLLKNKNFTCDDRFFIKGVSNKSIGSIIKDKDISREINICGKSYTVGIGGMHSNNKAEAYVANKDEYILDVDFASYYPALMVNNNFYPKSLSKDFSTFFKQKYQERKKDKVSNKFRAAENKIVLNSIFGKTNSFWSCMYDPETFLNITFTGQLVCLMLVEKLNEMGCEIISANTDGITFKGKLKSVDYDKSTVTNWSKNLDLDVDIVRYNAIYHESVNSYLALKSDGTMKGKGSFAIEGLTKSPASRVCIEAVINFIVKGTAIRRTIIESKSDIKKFIVVRKTMTGAYFKGKYLGKLARWYYGYGSEHITSANGSKVAGSYGAEPLMDLDNYENKPINIDLYVEKSYELLKRIGYGKN